MRVKEGTITIVQESRFQLTDPSGASHLFLLDHRSKAEPSQLKPLAQSQARVRVRYSPAPNLIGLVAHDVEILSPAENAP